MSILVIESKNKTDSKTRTENDHYVAFMKVTSDLDKNDVSAALRTETQQN